MEGIRWAPKVSQSKVWQLYQNDARGTVDETLVADVGLSLLARCKSIAMVTCGEVECPRCYTAFVVSRESAATITACPTNGCGWQVSFEHYHASWQHQDLLGGNIMHAIQAYASGYEHAKSVPERMVLIDQLLHAFHWDAKVNLPNRSAASNLIGGSHKAVVELLDKLTYGEDITAKQRWRENVQTMWQRRRGKL